MLQSIELFEKYEIWTDVCIEDDFLNSKNIIILATITAVIVSWIPYIVQGVSKRALQLWKRIEIYTEDIHNVLNCQNVAKHTEFYLW
jgi:hypothetical protein